MSSQQQIFKERRNYNQWVANQTLEDFALRFTAKSARRWSFYRVAITALGSTAFMALEAIGGSITLSYGFTNAVSAILAVAALLFITGVPISYYGAKYGVDIDLLTRGAGFGYLGSTITSLIYASFTFIFFAIESAILAVALEQLLGIPVFIGYIICAVAVIPIVTHGITTISKFQLISHYIWITLQIIAVFSLFYFNGNNVDAWVNFPAPDSASAENIGTDFNLILFGASSAVLFAMIAQIGEQVDYLRFLPEKNAQNQWRWWAAVISAGPGWVVIGVIKMLIGSFLAYLVFSQGVAPAIAADPTHMYQYVFNYVTNNPQLALVLACLMIILCQMKINVTNAYAGSIAWSNFFSRVTHNHPGRVVWLFFNVAIALMLMELGIYKVLENILGVFALIAISWLGSVSADLMINKPLGLSPKGIEFKRSHLYDANPVGLGSMLAASTVGLLSYLGVFGEEVKAIAHYLCLGTTFVMAPLIAKITKGRYYIARQSNIDAIDISNSYQCSVCENHFETEDMSHCPAYGGHICSLCCSLDSRCQDMCKTDSRLAQQVPAMLRMVLPNSIVNQLDSRIGRFIAALLTNCLLLGGLFALVYQHAAGFTTDTEALAKALWVLFYVGVILCGVICWVLLLAHESRVTAQEESNQQTQRLLQEINAHSVTDAALQEAKELAESANQAKSRYLRGISHELRTPLQSILGYAQLMSRDSRIPEDRQNALAIIKRSGEHLGDLVEGLLDISKIEAGRLELQKRQFDLHQLLAQLVNMFEMDAKAKGITFIFNRGRNIPRYVNSDEKQLRQILTNLLSNALKFTHEGSVSFNVNYRFQITEFTVTDTGVGIPEEDQERIFQSFERGTSAVSNAISGTGLGLTIARLLAETMGGDLSVQSEVNKGSTFTLSLLLSTVERPVITAAIKDNIVAYEGSRQKILVVDDQAEHRELIDDLLSPIGFHVEQASNGEDALNRIDRLKPDLILLDVSMPDMDGHQLAQRIRDRNISVPIIMVSAEAQESHEVDQPGTPHNEYMVKPIKITVLLEHIARLLSLRWVYSEIANNPSTVETNQVQQNAPAISERERELIEALKLNASIGYFSGVKNTLKQLSEQPLGQQWNMEQLQDYAKNMQFEKLLEAIGEQS